ATLSPGLAGPREATRRRETGTRQRSLARETAHTTRKSVCRGQGESRSPRISPRRRPGCHPDRVALRRSCDKTNAERQRREFRCGKAAGSAPVPGGCSTLPNGVDAPSVAVTIARVGGAEVRLCAVL